MCNMGWAEAGHGARSAGWSSDRKLHDCPDDDGARERLAFLKGLGAPEEKEENAMDVQPVFVAVLSTTVLPLDGVYQVTTLPAGERPDITGVPHYIGHPATREIVESLGAVPAPSKLFTGLHQRESAIAFSIRQGRSTRAVDGFSSPHQACGMEDLEVKVIYRVYEDSRKCPFCGGRAAVAVLDEPRQGAGFPWQTCPFCGAT